MATPRSHASTAEAVRRDLQRLRAELEAFERRMAELEGSVAEGSGSGSGAFTPAYHFATSNADVNYASTTWASITGVLTLSDVANQGISRSSSDYTFTEAGKYLFNCSLNFTGNTAVFGFRLRDVGGAVTHWTGWSNTIANTTNLYAGGGIITPTAGQTLRLQYAVSAAGANLPAQTVDSQLLHLANIWFFRIE